MLNLKALLTKLTTDTIKISGDQNLLRGANTISGTTGTWTSGTFRGSGSGGTVAYAQSITPPSGYSDLPSTGATITSTSASQQIGFCQDGCPIAKKEISFSVWVKGQSGDQVVLQPIWSGTSGQEESGSQTFTLSDSDWHHIYMTKTPNYAHSSVSLGYIYYYAPSGHVLYVLAPKIEYGPVPTGWVNNAKLTGELQTNWGQVVGSKQVSATTVLGLIQEVHAQTYGENQIGSVYIGTQYSLNGVVIPTGWYNYAYVGDKLLLFGMTVSEKLYVVIPNSSFNGITYAGIILLDNGTITVGNPTNGTTTNYNLNGTAGTHYYYCKYGNIVTVNLNVKCTTPASSWATFASGLPTHGHPTHISFLLGCADAGVQPMWCSITSSGELRGYVGTAGKTFYGSISYVTNS